MPRLARFSAAVTTTIALGAVLVGCSNTVPGTGDATESAAGDDNTTITVATSGQTRPYTYLDDSDQLTGYDIEVLRKVDERLPTLTFEFETADFQALFAGLDSGRYDMVANNLSATAERKEKYLFTAADIEASFGVVSVPGSALNAATSLDDLAGHTTYGTAGLNFTRVLEEFNANHPDNPIKIQYTELDMQSQYTQLQAGAVDFVFNEEVMYQELIDRSGQDLHFAPLDGQTLANDYGTNLYSAFAISQHTPNAESLVADINTVLRELYDNGTLSELSEQFLGGDHAVYVEQ